MNYRLLLFWIGLLLVAVGAPAQQIYIRGEVKDQDGNPLPNVAILQHSTGYVLRAGSTGGFGILSNKQTDTLSFSLDGYVSQKRWASGNQYLKVVLLRKTAAAAPASKLASFTRNLSREWEQPWLTGDETYTSIIENAFVPTHLYPATGIRLNVDRASYSNVRRFLKMRAHVPPDAVRIEEMLNYFNIGYEPPPPGQTFAIRPTLTECPWRKENQLLFVQVASRRLELDSLPPSHLTFLIDVSGSMDMPNRLPLLQSGFRGLVNNLRPVDSVSIVVYGGRVGVWLPTTSGGERERIFKAIDSLEPGGATPGESGIKLAYGMAQTHFIQGGNNRVILATDGDFNVGLRSEADLEALIAQQRQAGIYLTCLGVGMGNYKDSKIQALAQKGRGNFAYLDSYAEAENVLLKEALQTLYTVADDASFTVKFDPRFVKEYRLIGFDNKRDAIRDSLLTIEGGEIGPAYSSLLIFEVVPEVLTGTNHLKPAQFHLQYRVPGQKEMHQVTEQPLMQVVAWDAVQKPYQFAGSVALFGMLLRGSRFCRGASWDDVLKMAHTAVQKDNIAGQDFIKWVHAAKKIYGKKKLRKMER